MKLRRQVRGAICVYPEHRHFRLLPVSCRFCSGFVIPGFQNMFKDFGAKDELPALTKGVMAVSSFFIGNLLWIVLGVTVIVVGVGYTIRTPAGRKGFHKLLLRLPVVGPVLRKIAVARFTRTLGTLLASGVPILDALEIVAKTAGNIVVEEAIMYARARISEGKNMAQPLMETNVFPPMVVQMVGVGE